MRHPWWRTELGIRQRKLLTKQMKTMTTAMRGKLWALLLALLLPAVASATAFPQIHEATDNLTDSWYLVDINHPDRRYEGHTTVNYSAPVEVLPLFARAQSDAYCALPRTADRPCRKRNHIGTLVSAGCHSAGIAVLLHHRK